MEKMICLLTTSLLYLSSAYIIANYFLWSANTQAFYNYAMNDLHAVNGLSSLTTANDVTISEMGTFFASAAASRICLPPNNLVPYEYGIGTTFSMVFWVNPSNLLGTLIEKYDSGTLTVLLGVKLSSNSLQVTIMGQSMSGALGLTANTWQMVTVAFDCAGNCVVYAYRNVGEFSFSKSFTTTFTDNTAKSFFLGFSPSTTVTSDYVGYMSEFIFLMDFLTSSQLPNFLAYAGTTQCPFATCNDLCSINIYTPARCLRTTALVVDLCVDYCNSMDCAWFTDQHCFNVLASCHPTCLTCLDGVEYYNCYSCYDNTDILSYGSCLCHDGYYRNTNTWLCTLCDPTCLTCVTGTNTGCMTCKPNAILGATAGPAACPCNTGYYFETTTEQCTLCYKDCATCSTGAASGCLTCNTNAQLAGTTPNTCVCLSNYYYSTSSKSSTSCLPCNSTCKTCTGGSSNMCVTCFTGASVNGSGFCVCVTGYFPNATASNCSACDLTCLNCSGTASNNCISCSANASLSLGTCHCTTGFYPAATSAVCAACDPTCTACNIGGSTHCTGCYSNAVLVSPPESQCACAAGYYPSSTVASCLACDLSCVNCAGAGPSQCTSCKGSTVLLAPSASTCSCNSGYYQGTSYDCHPCNPTCATCSGTALNQCVTCKSNASISVVNPGQCECNSAFYPNPTAATCSACSTSCRNCSGPSASSCLTCPANAQLASSSPAACQCSPGFYLASVFVCTSCPVQCTQCTSPTLCTVCKDANASGSLCSAATECEVGFFFIAGGVCKLCDASCLTCSGIGPSNCLSCWDFAEIKEPGPSSCKCIEGTYPNPNAKQCSLCDFTCKSCVGPGSKECSSCYSEAKLMGDVPNQCECEPGHYLDSSARSCLKCSKDCRTCSNPSKCLSCQSNGVLQPDSTCWYEGGNSDTDCSQFSEACYTCIEIRCLSCMPGWYYFQGNCTRSCPLGYIVDEQSECKQIDLGPIEISLSLSPECYLIVTFSRSMRFNVTASDISLMVYDLDDDIFKVSWSDPIILSPTSLEIQFKVDAGTVPAGTQVTISLLHPEAYQESSSLPAVISNTEATIEYCSSDATNNPSQTVANSASKYYTVSKTVSQISTGALVTASLLNGSFTSLWSFMNQLQLLTYIPMTTIPVPSDLANTLIALSVVTLIPNPIEISVMRMNAQYTPPSYAEHYGITSVLILSNIGIVPAVGLGLMISVIPVVVISKMKSQCCIAKFSRKHLRMYRWSIPLRWWIQVFFDTGIYSLMQISTVGFAEGLKSPVLLLNSAFSWGFATAVIVSMFAVVSFFCTKRELISSRSSKEFNSRWGVFFLEFAATRQTAALLYYPLFFLRRFVYAISIVFLSNFAVVQAVLNTATSFLVTPTQAFALVVYYKPYSSHMEQLSLFITEASTMTVFLIVSLFFLDMPSETSEIIEMIGVWTVLGSIGCYTLLSLAQTAGKVVELWKTIRRRPLAVEIIKAKRILPEPSGRINSLVNPEITGNPT